MSNSKRTKKRKQSADKDVSEEETIEIIKPMQAPLFSEDLVPYILEVYPNPSCEWSQQYIEKLGALMANRGGFNSTHREAIAASGVGRNLDWFFSEYVKLYETNQHFAKLIDPWYVVCEGWPAGNAYVNALNAANVHIGGAPGAAGQLNEPIQFNNGRNWFLQCHNREHAQRVASFLHGRINSPQFHTSVIDSRFLDYN